MDRNDRPIEAEVAESSPRKRARRGGLARTLLLVFLPLVVGLVILTGLAGVVASLRVAETRVVEQLELVATLKDLDITRWVLERDRDLAVLVSDQSVREAAFRLLDEGTDEAERTAAYADLRIRLSDFYSKKAPYTEVFLLDAKDGRVVVSTDVLMEDSDHGNTDYFQQGLQDVFLRPPEFDPRVGFPTILMARPVRAEDGTTLGVLVGRVNLGDLTVLMQERTGMGDTGETYLVSQDYLALTGLRFGQPGQPVDTVGVRRAVDQKRSGSDRYENYQSDPVFGIYRWSPTLQAALLAEQSESEALASRTTVALVALGIVLMGGLLATVVIVYVSRRITRPLTRLTEAATEMAAGDLSQRVTVESRDEIGALSQAFDDMADQMAALIGTLEQRVTERTAALERRAVQLETTADVGRAAASILDLEVLTLRVVDLVQEGFDLYYVGLFLLDDLGQKAVLEAGTGEAGHIMKEAGHMLEVGGISMVGAACAQRRARIALDVGDEPVRFDNPLLPDTRSEMALPLVVGDRVLGALDVQSVREAAFSDEDIAVLQLVADQVAVAIDNARRFSEEAGLLEAASPMLRVSRRLATAMTTDDIVDAITTSVAETEADGCAVGRLDYSSKGDVASAVFLGAWDRHGESRFQIGVPFSAETAPLPMEMIMAYWTIEDVAQVRIPDAPRQFLAQFGGRAFVNVPLRAGARTSGFVSIYRFTAGPFSPISIRLYETLVDQASVAFERTRLLEETQRQAWREHAIRDATDAIRSAVSVEDAVRRAVRELGQALGASRIVARIGTEQDLFPEQRGNGHE